MSNPSKREIRHAIEDSEREDPYDTGEDLLVMVAAYREAIDCLREVLACEPLDIDNRIPYYTVQVDKTDYQEAMEIISRYPEEN